MIDPNREDGTGPPPDCYIMISPRRRVVLFSYLLRGARHVTAQCHICLRRQKTRPRHRLPWAHCRPIIFNRNHRGLRHDYRPFKSDIICSYVLLLSHVSPCVNDVLTYVATSPSTRARTSSFCAAEKTTTNPFRLHKFRLDR